jgi:hypothetical protein
MFDENLEKVVNLPLVKTGGKATDDGFIRNLAHRSAVYTVLRPFVKREMMSDLRVNREQQIEHKTFKRKEMARALGLIRKIHQEFPTEEFFVYYIPDWPEFALDVVYKNVRLFKELCAEMGMKGVSLTDVVEDGVETRRYYIPVDRHFSEDGTRIVAAHVASLLRGDRVQGDL